MISHAAASRPLLSPKRRPPPPARRPGFPPRVIGVASITPKASSFACALALKAACVPIHRTRSMIASCSPS